MQFSQYTCIKDFFNATYDIIMSNEAQTILPLGGIVTCKEDADKKAGITVRSETITAMHNEVYADEPGHNTRNLFMATVSDENGIHLTAIMTPPKEMSLYSTNNIINQAAITCLIEGMAQAGISLPGLMAEKQLTEAFSAQYTARHNLVATTTMNQRIYELTKVNPAIPKASLRLAQERDMSFLPYWDSAYFHEAIDRPNIINPNPETYLEIIRANNVYIMEKDGVPVAMARISRALKTVCYISYAFTPPYFRKRGYQTACTAALSQLALDRGFAKVVLFTDLANTTANNIYQKIGYYPIGDSLQVRYESIASTQCI